MAKPSSVVMKAIGEAAIPITKRIKLGPHKIGSVELHESKTNSDYDAILEAIGPNTKVVMIGEASHGTMEFYRHRAEITKRLVTEMGFNIVACEADWPDALRVNDYVSGKSTDKNAKHALGDFTRFPRWMWRNVVVEEFVEWMKSYNQLKEKEDDKVGFYGLDVYSFAASRRAVIDYLTSVDPEVLSNHLDLLDLTLRSTRNSIRRLRGRRGNTLALTTSKATTSDPATPGLLDSVFHLVAKKKSKGC